MKTLKRTGFCLLLLITISLISSFSVMAEDSNNTKDNTSVTSLSFDQSALYLSTAKGGTRSAEVSLSITPASAVNQVNWSIFSTTEVAKVESKGLTAKVTALSPGVAILTATAGDKTADITVYIMNTAVITDGLSVTSTSPDAFTVIVKNVRPNPALENQKAEAQKVTLQTWSTASKSDLNVKEAKLSGSDWICSFPINDTGSHNYYVDADNIQIHCYASTDEKSSGELLYSTVYSWLNSISSGSHSVGYIAYSKNIGFVKPTAFNGQTAGTTGQALRMEGVRVSSNVPGVQIQTSVHAQNIGWMAPVNDGVYAGTMDEHRQIEAVILTKSGVNADQYQLKYRVHVQNLGWLDWVDAGQVAGTTGQSLRMEAIEIQLIAND